MKKNTHPKCFKDAAQKCACGAIFNIPSAKKDINIEICSQCHPFYTGKEKIVDVTGQVDKFKKRAAKTKTFGKAKKTPKKKKKIQGEKD